MTLGVIFMEHNFEFYVPQRIKLGLEEPMYVNEVAVL